MSVLRPMRSVLIALSVLALAACDEKTPENAAASSSSASSESAAAPSVVASAAPSAAVDDKPRSKETSSPGADKLGTLPDGVGLSVGSQMPDVALTNSSGESVELKQLTAKGKTMLVFYRGGWCPYCNFQI